MRLKALLMDQKFIAGIGNIYSDEILFQAGLRWDRMSDSLSQQEMRRLYRAIVETLQDAVKYRGSSLADEQYRRPLRAARRVPAPPPGVRPRRRAVPALPPPVVARPLLEPLHVLLRGLPGVTPRRDRVRRPCVIAGRVQGVWFRGLVSRAGAGAQASPASSATAPTARSRPSSKARGRGGAAWCVVPRGPAPGTWPRLVATEELAPTGDPTLPVR